MRNSFASVEPADTISDFSEKQSRILVMATWYLPILDCLRRFFSNPKDAELMRCLSDLGP
jgi:hypothetical protein